jgi:aconitate hydratase
MAVVAALSGSLLFNPETAALENNKGEQVKLSFPWGEELPAQGFTGGEGACELPPEDGSKIEIAINPASDRLQKLAPFPAWDGKDIEGARLLIKVAGKCTTDHISMAGKWLKYRGHLENISNNLLIGALNMFNHQKNVVLHQPGGEPMEVPASARAYKAEGIPTIVVGDENYGEGSSREHAAMEPRYLGVRAVIARSFARIHETNLKKQGMLPLTFAGLADYEKVREDDVLSILGLKSFAEGKPFVLRLTHADGTTEEVPLNHTLNKTQWQWFVAGSALNLIKMRGM